MSRMPPMTHWQRAKAPIALAWLKISPPPALRNVDVSYRVVASLLYERRRRDDVATGRAVCCNNYGSFLQHLGPLQIAVRGNAVGANVVTALKNSVRQFFLIATNNLGATPYVYLIKRNGHRNQLKKIELFWDHQVIVLWHR